MQRQEDKASVLGKVVKYAREGKTHLTSNLSVKQYVIKKKKKVVTET